MTRPPEGAGGRLRESLRGIRGRLLLLLLVAGVPVIGIAGANAWQNYEIEMAAGRHTAAMLREVAAARHRAALEDMKRLVRGLARSPALRDATAEQCDALLAAQLAIDPDRYTNIWMLEADGSLRCSARPARRGMSLAHLSYFREVHTEQDYVLGEFATGVFSGLPVLSGAAPMLADDQVIRVVGASILLAAFVGGDRSALAQQPHRLWLLDKAGRAFALDQGGEDDLPPPDTLASLTAAPITFSFDSASRAGRPFAYAVNALDADLHLLAGLPTASIAQAARAALARRVAELGAFLLACLLAILVGVELGVARPLRALAQRVRAWRPGEPFPQRATGVEPVEVRALEDALANAAATIAAGNAELRTALRRCELLLAEIHHRVKNNLQIVASLLNLQAGRLRDPTAKAEFGAARDRVQALATLHRHLYVNQSFETIALRPFLDELGPQLFAALGEAPGERIALSVEADELEISTDQAVSLALLVTEAVTNSVKHGFADGRRGRIEVRVQREGNEAALCCRDDGIGVAAEAAENGPGIGMALIRGFAAHLGGTVELDGTAGTHLHVRFPLRSRAADTMAA